MEFFNFGIKKFSLHNLIQVNKFLVLPLNIFKMLNVPHGKKKNTD